MGKVQIKIWKEIHVRMSSHEHCFSKRASQSQVALQTRNTAWAVPIYYGGAQGVLRLNARVKRIFMYIDLCMFLYIS